MSVTRCLLVLFVVLALITDVSAKKKRKKARKDLRCGVCLAIADEMEEGIKNTKEKYEVQTRFRIEEKARIPYARTEYRLIQILENDVKDMLKEEYSVKEFDGGKKALVFSRTLTNGSGIKQGPGISQDIMLAYDRTIELDLEIYVNVFRTGAEKSRIELRQELCVKHIKACSSTHPALNLALTEPVRPPPRPAPAPKEPEPTPAPEENTEEANTDTDTDAGQDPSEEAASVTKDEL